MFQPVTFETERLRLRPLRLNDAADLFEIWSDPEAMRYFPFEPLQSVDQAIARVQEKLRLLEDGRALICTVESTSTHEVIGDCSIFGAHEVSKRAEIGYSLKRQY